MNHVSRFTFHAPRFTHLALATILLTFALTHPASAKPSQSDVFKSIQENVGQSDDSMGKAIPWLCAGAGVIIVLAIFGRRQTREAAPRPLNNPGRLIREIMKTIPLKPKELKQLKVVADETPIGDNATVCSPLVLLLCPSVLAKASRGRVTRADRRVLVQVLRKLQVS